MRVVMPRTRSQADAESCSDMPASDVSPPAECAPLADGSAPPPSTSVVMTDQQLLRLAQLLQMQSPTASCVSATPALSQGHFAKCTARFDGAKDSDVIAFIDAIEIYKECVGIEGSIALRGLPMLLTGLAATWWQGVKSSIESWSEAIKLLKQTYGPRLPPHRIYRELFAKEQTDEETTDIFVCRARALIAQLPIGSLKEDVQLDMIYGLMTTKIREKVPRSGFNTFSELLCEARRVEDLFEEGRPRRQKSDTASKVPSAAVQKPTNTNSTETTFRTSKTRPICAYCKKYGHEKADCIKLRGRNQLRLAEGTSTPSASTTSSPATSSPASSSYSPLVCFGCGAPGVIRANCAVCKEKSSTPAFQSLAAVSATHPPRSRPVLSVEIYGKTGTLLIDTGAKQSVASDSLYNYLCVNKHPFENVRYSLKFADGKTKCNVVKTALIDVKVRGVVIPTQFIVLPGATESLLGINFIRDAGMVFDFGRNQWSLRGKSDLFLLEYEDEEARLSCSAVDLLREDEGSLLASQERIQLSTLLEDNKDVFEPGGAATSFAVHRIDTGEHPPISVPPYRVPPGKKEIMRKEIDKMLAEGVIEEADSEWTSPVVLVPKKNGTIRFCVDYRNLNKITRADKYPLPLIDELLQSTKKNSVMSSIDLKSGYWQIEVAPEDRDKTAFVSPFGTFRFRRMPFGLRNSPATFQRLIDRFRSGLKDITIVCYLDDILIISDNLEEHLSHLRQVFDRLRLFNLRANRDKCVFGRERLTYLGHVISPSGIEPDHNKIQAVLNRKAPKCLKELRTFLQTCSWFRKFIPEFSATARPLTELTKKNRKWVWETEQVQAFELLKQKLSTAPILIQPDWKELFVLRTDASAYALGAVLLQGSEPKEERPIEYASRLLTTAERNYNTTEREALAVVWALEKFRGYIEGAEVHIATDHQPLRWLMSLKTPSGRLARWAMKIQGYNLDIQYCPGKANVIADTLSRPVGDASSEEEPCAICPIVVDLPTRGREEVRAAQLEDSECKKIIEDFEAQDSNLALRWTDRGYYMTQGVLYRCDPEGEIEEPLLVLPEIWREEVMKQLHDAPTAGHLGVERTLRKLMERYYFRGMRTYVSNYVKACDVCSKYKPANLKPAGLLQTPVPQQRFEVLAMDLFGPLPEGDKGERWIFLVEDTATRWVELFALVDANAENCAKILIEEIFMRYGLPRRIISDNGSQFVSAVMQKALFVLGVRQALTPAYHPEANPAERKNRDMKQRLAMILGLEHRKWPEVLSQTRFALNTAYNSGTGETAAYLMFARNLRSPIDVNHDMRTIAAKENFVPQITPYLRNFGHILQRVRYRVEEQQDARKEVADKQRRPAPSFKVGDLVLVDSHALSNTAKGFTSKFAPRRNGPFVVAEFVSPTTFLLRDSLGVTVGKYHTSTLTPYHGRGNVAQKPRRGRPARSRPGRTCDLEGEDIARHRPSAVSATPFEPHSRGRFPRLRASHASRDPYAPRTYPYSLRPRTSASAK